MSSKILFIFLWGIFTIYEVSADTIVPGGYVSGTWTAAGSPYLVQGDITVHADSTLNIEPGVEVNFQGTTVSPLTATFKRWARKSIPFTFQPPHPGQASISITHPTAAICFTVALEIPDGLGSCVRIPIR